MQTNPIRFGLAAVPAPSPGVAGGLVDWRGASFYRISDYDALDPFLTTVVSDCDLWLYVASTGGLTAGRATPSHALFPYETVDKLFRSHAHTGPRTVLRVLDDAQTWVWEPFANDGRLRYELRRSLFKHVLGCELWFEEENVSLGMTFRYGWRPGRRFGWVRTCELSNDGRASRRVALMDGVRNIMPAGVETALQDTFSCLVDAYRTAEHSNHLALFRLTSRIIDRAEASEMLHTTVAWRAGLPRATTYLDDSHRDAFIRGVMPRANHELHGRPGSYLVCDEIALEPGRPFTWHIVLDTPVDHAGVAALEQAIAEGAESQIEADVRESRARLRRLLASSDALQCTEDAVAVAHHASNTLFNIARGGVPANQYHVDRDDFACFLTVRNRRVVARHAAWLASLPARLSLPELQRRANDARDTHLWRASQEYLPIIFSRRHGDPSRPWNRFAIAVDNPDGSVRYAYEGNWRDIFQNWEALCRSFPEFIEPVITKFLNASTADGFNPYRITQDGIEWETPDPAHPWSSIGYWGDHQIVYLLRLLEMSVAHHPDRLAGMLGRRGFTYADVPYRIRSYADVVANPQQTIVFDAAHDRAVQARVAAMGTDGRLIQRDDSPLFVTMAEKLLVPVLAKVSNLVPGGGIWMNTMRPEWNDANNALVGNGVSMVTACHLHRHLECCAELFDRAGSETFEISSHVARWLSELSAIVRTDTGAVMNDRARRAFLDACGQAFSRYRDQLYASGPGEPAVVTTKEIVTFLRDARALLRATLVANRRPDGLYHAYNLLHLGHDTAEVSHLPLMLEGQVAVLGSGWLAPAECVALLDALRASDLYRHDLQSYLLYPEKQLPAFTMMNRVPGSILQAAPVLAARVAAGDHRILVRDAGGQLRFHADLHNAEALRRRLDDGIPAGERAAILDAYEAVFNHRAFTGRSGTMYRYEGIGCIYWHMVAKLWLAALEAVQHAAMSGASSHEVAALRRHADDIRAGLGFTRSPAAFGAFPLDAYSHTPAFGGASQPGLTGQVKEEILARWIELGVRVENGSIVFEPAFARPGEFVGSPRDFIWIAPDGEEHSLALRAGDLAFTYCQIPIVYSPGADDELVVHFHDGREQRLPGTSLPAGLSARAFSRTGEIGRVTVHFRSG